MSEKAAAEAAKTKVTTGHDREIVSERIFDAPREKVFAAMTDPELIPQWWGGEDRVTIVDEMDVRPGGSWRFRTGDCEEPDPREAFRGTFREIVPPERVVQTFEWEGMPGHVAVDTATLEDLGDGRTRLVISTVFHTTEERDGMLGSGMEKGINESHDKLQELLAE